MILFGTTGFPLPSLTSPPPLTKVWMVSMWSVTERSRSIQPSPRLRGTGSTPALAPAPAPAWLGRWDGEVGHSSIRYSIRMSPNRTGGAKTTTKSEVGVITHPSGCCQVAPVELFGRLGATDVGLVTGSSQRCTCCRANALIYTLC